MKIRHNMTIQGQRNTAVSDKLQARADLAMKRWRQERREDGNPVPDLPPAEPLKFEGKGHRRRWKHAQRRV